MCELMEREWNNGREEGRKEGELFHLIDQVVKKRDRNITVEGIADALEEEEEWKEKLKKWDEEMERIREQNRRERELLQEARIRKKRIQKKLQEKLALKKYLARQDEIMQMNEKISLERAVGEDVYIEKAPLSKSLSIAEIMAFCSEF